jgi:hypothetical protein
MAHRTERSLLVTAAAAAIVSIATSAARGKVTVLQNGVSPSEAYAGCVDTWISNESWETNRDQGGSATLRAGGQRHVLIRFDLAPVPKDETIHKAVLRIADTGFPRPGRDGQFAPVLSAYALTCAWDANANWLEHTRTDYKAANAGDWRTPGGEHDAETDFGRTQKGLIAIDATFAGPWGHVHELDVTEAVRRWQAGTLANHGLLLKGADRSRCELASADWPVAAYRPKLIVDHGPKAAGIEPLASAPKDAPLHPLAETPDTGKGDGTSGVIRVGQNRVCQLRGRSASAYVKENVAQFPGTWGWMTQCRVGGVAGDFSRTLLYFDLDGIPRGGSIQQAKLVCSLVSQTAQQVRSYRYGAFLVKLPEAPGWSADEATAALRKAGAAWPAGGVRSCTDARPLAIGRVTQKEILRQGRKTKVDAGIEFDLTGAVRAWLAGKAANCGILLDNRLEGGAYDVYSSRAFRAELRPYLEIGMSPAPDLAAKPLQVELAPPPGDYWVEPMRKVHASFKGKAGTLGQYGDSITVTMAYLASYGWSGKIDAKNMTPETQADARTVEQYADLTLWRTWKGGEWGNTGMMRSDWLFRNVDGWQRKMQPEAAVIMFGTNDIGGLWPPEYTENMAASLRRMMADGTVPMLTSIPPANRDGHREYWLAALSIAHGLKVPLIDYYAEILRRRPDDWNGRLDKFAEYRQKGKDGYQVPTLVSADGTHPSNPRQWLKDFSEEALSRNGYVLRDYMTIRMYGQIIRKVFKAKGN